GGDRLGAYAHGEPDPQEWEPARQQKAVAGETSRRNVVEACGNEVPLNSAVRPIVRAAAHGRAALRREVVDHAANAAARGFLMLLPLREAVGLDSFRYSERAVPRARPPCHSCPRSDRRAGEPQAREAQETHGVTT